MIRTDLFLKIALPICNDFVVRFGSRWEIIRLIDSLLVEIHVNMWQPLIVALNTLLGFNLRHPCPIAIQVEQIVIWTSTRPWFLVFRGKFMKIRWRIAILLVKVHIAISTIWIQTWIHDYNGIRQVFCFVR